MSEVLDIEQVQQVYSKYANLTVAMQRIVLNDPTVKNASPRLLDIWHYTNRFIGETGFVYHAAQVARMCGLAYATKQDRNNFKVRFLEEHGAIGVDWDFVKKSEVFQGGSGETSMESQIENSMILPVPGSTTGETVTISPGGNAAKFPMLTEKFARRLILRCGQKGLDKDYAEFLLAMNDIVVRVATGQGVHTEAEEQSRGTKRPATWREELEYKERTEKLELERAKRLREEAISRQEQAKFYLEMLKAFQGDGSERDQILQMDFQRSFMTSLHKATLRELDGNTTPQDAQLPAIQDAQPEYHEITISEVALRILSRMPTNGELQKFGRKTAQLYRQKYKSDPPKRVQYVDGAPRQVNSYTTKDLDLIEKAIHEVMN